MPNKTAHLPLPHLLLALAVATVWGTNFVVIRIGLDHLPPLLLACLRFIFAFLPAAFFVPRPAVSWGNLIAFGVLIGAGQFGCLYLAMSHGISPGLASLVVQTQVFFTIGLAVFVIEERVHLFQIAALGVAATGLVLIAVHGGHDATPIGVSLALTGAMCWAGGNLLARISGAGNKLGYVVWSSFFAIPPLAVLSLIFEGWPAIAHGLAAADAVTWGAVLYQSLGNTLFGYGSWTFLLARHPASTVSPFALLVPIVGMASSALVLGEPLQAWKLIAAALVLSGLALSVAWPGLRAALARA